MIRQSLFAIGIVVFTFALTACGGDDALEPPVGSVEGTVTLEGQGATEGVTVQFKDSNTSAETLEDGTFVFEEVAPGNFTLVVSHPEYVTEEVDIEVTDQEVTTVDVELEQVNVAPQISDVVLDPEALSPSGTATVTVTASDGNPDELTYEYSATNGFEVSSEDGASATITAPDEFDAQGELTVTVSDPDGAQDSRVINLITIDNQAPVIGGIVAIPSTLAPGGTSSVSVNATDADGDELTYEWTAPSGWTIDDASAADIELTAPETYGEVAVIEVTVTDEKGVSASSQTTVETAENSSPVISSLTATPPQTTPGGEIQLEASVSDPDGTTLTYEWTGPSEWTISDATIANPTVTAPSSYGASGRISLTVTDEGGATASSSIVLSTNQNDGPLISSVTATPSTVARGGDIELSVTASDPNGDTLSYSWSAPSGWSLDDSTAQSPTLTAPGQNSQGATISVTVTDSEGLASTGSVVVSTEANQAPVISSLDAQPSQVAPGGSIEVSANATDANGDAVSYAWTPPSGWSMTGSGDTITLTAPGDYGVSGSVMLEVSDGFGGTATAQISVSTVSNQAPTISSVSAANNTLTRSASTVVTVSASDPNGDALTYAFDFPNNANWSVDASTPGDDNKATITASDTAGDTATLEVTVTDADGLSAMAQLSVSVENNAAPTISSLSSSQNPVARGGTLTFSVDASDANSADTLSYAWSLNNNDWSISAGATTDEITVSAPDMPDSTVTATVTVSDDAGGSSQATTTVSTRANREPLITSTPPSTTVHASGRVTWTYQVSAQDADDSNLTYTLDNDGTTASIDSNTGLITWEPLRGDDGSYQFVIEVSDGYDTTSQQISMTAEEFDFEEYESFSTSSTRYPNYADLDGDGLDDIVGVNWGGSNSFMVGFWVSSEGWNQKYEVSNLFTDYPSSGTDSEFYDCRLSAFLELDGDSNTDMVVACRYRRNASTNAYVGGPFLVPLFGNASASANGDKLSQVSPSGQQSVPLKVTSGNSNYIRGLDTGDVDGDGDLDVATSRYYYNGSQYVGRLEVYINNGDGTLTEQDSAEFTDRFFVGAMVLVDWDDDGTSEIMVSGYPNTGGSNQGGLYAYDLASNGDINTTEVDFLPAGRDSNAVASADFDGDGNLDVVTSSRRDGVNYTDTVQIYTGDGAGAFTLSEKRDLGSQYCLAYNEQNGVDVGDFDADGQVDVLLPSQDWNRCPYIATILFGDGQGGTGERVDIDGTNSFQQSESVHTVDWNGDGLDDIATSYAGTVRGAY